MVTNLPPGLAGLLNTLYWGDPNLEEELEVFSALWHHVADWHNFTSAYAMNQGEKAELANIKTLYLKVNEILEGDELSLEALAPPVYETFQLMESVNQRRRGSHYSPLPAINELLLAGAALCMGEGEPRGVEERLGLAQGFLDNYKVLAQDYRRKMKLDDSIRAEFKKGFDLVQEGLASAALGLPDPEAVADALAQVKAGASIIEVLAEWDRERSLALRETHTRFKIPQVGDEFEMALNGLQRAERSKWSRHIKYFRDVVMVELEDFVELVRPGLMLPNDVREELWERVAEAIEFVHQALDDLESEEFEDADAVAQFENAAEETSAAFSDIDAYAMKGEHLVGRPEETVFSAIRGILADSVPDAALPELCAQIPLAPEVTEPLDLYLQTRDASFLFDAAEALIHSVPVELEIRREPWSCSFCGHHNSEEQQTCSKCQAAPKGWTG
jgi:hypothetical protein